MSQTAQTVSAMDTSNTLRDTEPGRKRERLREREREREREERERERDTCTGCDYCKK